MEKHAEHKKGYFMGLAIAIGLPMGVPVGLVIGNIVYGLIIGLCISLAVGYGLERKYKGSIPEMTTEEKRRQRLMYLLMLGIGLLFLIIFTTIYFAIR